METGLVDINGEKISLGDRLRKVYINPFGELTDELESDDYYGVGDVTFENGSFCLRIKSSPDPIYLHQLLKTSEGEYVPNYGNKTIYTNIVAAQIINLN